MSACAEHLLCMLQVLWMNTVLKVMWPYYNQAIGQQELEQTGPIIAEQLKPVRACSFMARFARPSHAACCNAHLGHRAPKTADRSWLPRA